MLRRVTLARLGERGLRVLQLAPQVVVALGHRGRSGGRTLVRGILFQPRHDTFEASDVGMVGCILRTRGGELGLRHLQPVGRRIDALSGIGEHHGVGLQLRQLRLEIHLLLIEGGLARLEGPALLIDAIEHLQIHLRILGQLLEVLFLERRQLRLELLDPMTEAISLGFEEGGGIHRQLLAIVEVLVQIQRRQLVGYLGSLIR